MGVNEILQAKSDLYRKYPLISALTLIFRMISFYFMRILSGRFIIQDKKDKIDMLTKKQSHAVFNEMNIREFQ